MEWSKFKRKLYRHPRLFKACFIFIFALIIFFCFYLLFPWLSKIFKGPRRAISLLTADTSSLDSYNNRVNLLILGISGEREGEQNDLTDTILFASIDKDSADTVIISIPRDIWIENLKTKINAIYHYGEEKSKGGGFILTQDAVYQILDQEINYSVLIDFRGFIRMVDLLGGIEVNVDQSFDDYRYPIAGKENDDCQGDVEYKCRYEHLHFNAGPQLMDGQTALKFVRSRHAQGEEGTDFARSQRQQKVIKALIQKTFSYKILLNPGKIGELKKTFGDHVKFSRELSKDETTAFLSLFFRFVKNKKEIRTISLDYGDEDNPGFLYNPPLEKYQQWVLLPRHDNWQEIQKYIKEKIYKGY